MARFIVYSYIGNFSRNGATAQRKRGAVAPWREKN